MWHHWPLCAVLLGAAISPPAQAADDAQAPASPAPSMTTEGPRYRPLDEQPPREPGRTSAQLLLGFGTALGGFLTAVSGGGSGIVFLATPAAVGGLVCLVGNGARTGVPAAPRCWALVSALPRWSL
jgi:hypothetical protein